MTEPERTLWGKQRERFGRSLCSFSTLPSVSAMQAPPGYSASLPLANLNDEAARRYLAASTFPVGFQTLLLEECVKIPLRFFICDDSGSMYESDGQLLVVSGTKHKAIVSSRWQELTNSLGFHVQFAKAAQAPCEFRLLNALPPKMVGDPNSDPDFSNVRALEKVFEGSPQGGTPLCRHINDVVAFVSRHESELRANGQKVSLIICTDGVSSDGDVTVAMRPLKNLPVMVVVRLCTNDDNVTAYWNKVEADLEMSLDIIDDFFGEGKEIFSANPWLNYGMPLHRIREFGVNVKELDMLDEKRLTSAQMVKVLSILFNCKPASIPQPAVDWGDFEKWVINQLQSVPQTFNPCTPSVYAEPWINVRTLRECYGPPAGCCTIA